jgi:hypothetical protein
VDHDREVRKCLVVQRLRRSGHGQLIFNGVNALVTIADAPSLPADERNDARGVGQPDDGEPRLAGRDLQGQRQLLPGGDLPAEPRRAARWGSTFGETWGTAALAANTWTHLGVTYDRVTLRLYLNGVQVSSKARTQAIATSASPLQLGGDSLFGQYFSGTIDEVRVYSNARSAAQIQTDMNTPIG